MWNTWQVSMLMHVPYQKLVMPPSDLFQCPRWALSIPHIVHPRSSSGCGTEFLLFCRSKRWTVVFSLFLQWIMNGLSVSELCCLFCCPPCPSRIAAKLAFLPPEPTYALLPDLEAGSVPAGAATAPSLRSRGGGAGGSTSGGSAGAGGVSAAGEGRWKLHLTERAEFQYSQRELDATEVFLTRSSRGNRVGCMYIRCAPSARWEWTRRNGQGW